MEPGLDWDFWLGPAPQRPYNSVLSPRGVHTHFPNWRSYREYSGGGMTDWGAHHFDIAQWGLGMDDSGPVEILPPDGKDIKTLTYVFANGLRMYHGGGWGGLLSFRGTEGDAPDPKSPKQREAPPNIHIPNYKGSGGIFGDFLHCVRTRERPFRDIEIAHRACTVCHLGNIAYWLKRPLRWDPVKEEIIKDPEAARWLDRTRREPWVV